MFANGHDNVNDNRNNITFSVKETKLYVSVVPLSAKDVPHYLLKDQFIEVNTKQKVRIKIQQMNIDIFSKQTLLELIDYLDDNCKRFKAKRYFYQKALSEIITLYFYQWKKYFLTDSLILLQNNIKKSETNKAHKVKVIITLLDLCYIMITSKIYYIKSKYVITRHYILSKSL